MPFVDKAYICVLFFMLISWFLIIYAGVYLGKTSWVYLFTAIIGILCLFSPHFS